MKQTDSESNLVTLSVKVRKDTYDRFKVVCEREYRPMAAELRRLVEQRVGEDLGKAA